MVVPVRGIFILFFISVSLHDAIADDTLSNSNPDEGIEDINGHIEAIMADTNLIELSEIDVVEDDTVSNGNPSGIEDIGMKILELNPELIKTEEVEGRSIDDNQVKINNEFDREV